MLCWWPSRQQLCFQCLSLAVLFEPPCQHPLLRCIPPRSLHRVMVWRHPCMHAIGPLAHTLLSQTCKRAL